MKKSLLSALTLLAVGSGVSSCSKGAQDAPRTGDLSAETELTAPLSGSLQTDSLALVDLFNSLGGMNWSNSNYWASEQPVSKWYGVQVTKVAGEPRVTALYLGANNLKGTIPASIGQLTALRTLQLQYNREISGSIPEELFHLTRLNSLRLRFTNLTGELPAAIGQLKEIDTLDLSNSRYDLSQWWNGDPKTAREHRDNLYTLSGKLPREIGQLTKARYIDLSFQGFTGDLPAELGNLSALRYLSIYGCHFTGGLPAELGKLQRLEYLSAGLNELSKPLPAELGNLSNLRELLVSYNKIEGQIPASLGRLKKLKNLNLEHNKLSGEIPAELASLEGLYQIYLNDNQLSGQIPTDFGGAQQNNLLWVDLRNNQLTGSIPARIKRTLPEAEKYAAIQGIPSYGYTIFVLSGNKLTGSIPAEYLAYPKTLKHLVPQQEGYGFSNEPK